MNGMFHCSLMFMLKGLCARTLTHTNEDTGKEGSVLRCVLPQITV